MTLTHSDTNDIICYMIVFWELNSYWGNFKIFLHGEWNEKIWIIMWTYFLHKWKIQFWNFGSLCDHYGSLCEILHRFEILDHYVIIMKWKIHYLAQVSWTGWYIDIGFESLIFLLLKKLFFFNISIRPNQLNHTAKNRTAIGRKTDPRRCASVPIMKKPISIGSVINLE